MTDLDVSLAIPRWQIWADRIFLGIGYVVTRGALLAVGGVAVFLGYAWGWGDGSDSGFQAGCRATTTDTACLYAEDSGNQIRKIRLSAKPGKALSASQSGALDVLCDDLRDSVSRRMAAHYGCDEQ